MAKLCRISARFMPSVDMIKWLNWLGDVLCPQACLLCYGRVRERASICPGCLAGLPRLLQFCHQCAHPLSDVGESVQICGECLRHPPPFDRIISAFYYGYPVNQLLSALKFRSQLPYGRLFGHLMIQCVQRYYPTIESLPDCVIAVPLHWRRLQQRGFNQALELARPIARHFGCTLDINCCQRIRATEPQTQTPAKLRRQNVAQAFVVQSLPARHIAIVDDVVTTGHTVAALSRALRKAGASRIEVWCCARAGRNLT